MPLTTPPPPPPRSSSFATLTSALSWTLSHLPTHSSTTSRSPSGTSTPTHPPPSITPPTRRPITPTPISLTGYSPTTTSHLLSPSLADHIRNLLPARQQLHETWTLTYSLEQHGVSLSTLYTRSSTHPQSAYVLVVKDTLGGVFGAYVNECFRISSGGRYYGTGECFLWKAERDGKDSGDVGMFKAFPASGVNDYVILCEPGWLSMGGGDGRYGLWLDDRFERGVSQTCLTFGNEPLSEASGGKFEVLDVELWRVGP